MQCNPYGRQRRAKSSNSQGFPAVRHTTTRLYPPLDRKRPPSIPVGLTSRRLESEHFAERFLDDVHLRRAECAETAHKFGGLNGCCLLHIKCSGVEHRMRNGHFEASSDDRSGMRNDDAESSLVFLKRNTHDQNGPYFSQITEINQPEFTALDAWEGHVGRLDPRFQQLVGRELP